MFRARDAAGQVLAGDQPSLTVDCISICIARWLTEDRNRSVGFVEPHHSIVRDIGPDEIASGGKPCRTFRPPRATPEAFDPCMPYNAGFKAGIDDFEPGSLYHSEHRPVFLRFRPQGRD